MHTITLFYFYSMTTKSTIYLIPVPLFEEEHAAIPEDVKAKAVQLKYYFVENVRTARRALKLYDKSVDIDAIEFEEMNHRIPVNKELFQSWVKAGHEIGIMSEAGMPAVADPGNVLVAMAHRMQAKVRPFVGPSSILLSLAASGMNGQHFEFLGYLPVENAARNARLKEIEATAALNTTQIFIETPYRNRPLLESILKQVGDNLSLTIAYNITGNDEFILTQTIQQWKESKAEIPFHKKPCIFLIGISAG